jgi:hypothetical protein
VQQYELILKVFTKWKIQIQNESIDKKGKPMAIENQPVVIGVWVE